MFKLVCVVILVVIVKKVQSTGCHIRLQNSIAPEKSPIYLRRDAGNKYNLLLPSDREISLGVGEEIFMACADPKNRFELNKSVDLQPAYCVDRTTFNIFGQKHDFNEIKCVNPIKGTVKETGIECGNGKGVIMSIGFSFDGGKEFIELIETCYNKHLGEAMYAVHILYHPKAWERLPQRPFFGTSGSGREVDMIKSYKQVTQKTTFKKLLGQDMLADKYIYPNSYLSRGHLAPSADFPFATWKAATFYFINVVPEWVQVNSGNWETVERMVRNLAHNYHENMYVISGALDILTLPNVNGQQTPLYLDKNQKIPVPKYLWKMVINSASSQGIVFVALNNPFEQQQTHLDFCTDVCKQANFASNDWSNVTAGLVTCCTVDEFHDKIKYLPTFNQKFGLLVNK